MTSNTETDVYTTTVCVAHSFLSTLDASLLAKLRGTLVRYTMHAYCE